MNKKELLIVILVLVFAVVAGGLAVAMTGDNKSSNTADTSQHEHDETNSDDHHSHESSSAPENVEDLTGQTEVMLDIKDSAFSKRDIKVKKGTRVSWTNLDSVEHNVMLEHDASEHAHDAPKASEVKPDVFAGPLLKAGESYSFTFNEVGVNPYHSAPQPDMQGSVTVFE